MIFEELYLQIVICTWQILQDMKTHRKGEIQITNEKGNGNNAYMMVMSYEL